MLLLEMKKKTYFASAAWLPFRWENAVHGRRPWLANYRLRGSTKTSAGRGIEETNDEGGWDPKNL